MKKSMKKSKGWKEEKVTLVCNTNSEIESAITEISNVLRADYETGAEIFIRCIIGSHQD